MAQFTEESDTINDCIRDWPKSLRLVELGEVKLGSMMEENAKEQKKKIFDPIPRVEGVEAGSDPLLEMRATVYLISGRERRAT